MRIRKLFVAAAGTAFAAAVVCALPSSAFASGYVATYNDKYYETLQSAICDARSGIDAEVTLIANVSENVTIDYGSTVKLNLSNYTLKALDPSKPAVENSGTLVISASSGGKVTQDRGSGYYYGAIYNKSQGNLTINSGTFEYTSVTSDDSQRNSGPAVLSNGTLSINGGTFTTAGSSYGAVRSTGAATVTSGSFSCTSNSGYDYAFNVDGGKTTVKGGTFSNASKTTSDVFKTRGTLTIEGGVFNGSVYSNNSLSYVTGGVHTSITGGTINGSVRNELVIANESESGGKTPTELVTVVSGGAVVMGKIENKETREQGATATGTCTMTLNGGSFADVSAIDFLGTNKTTSKAKDGLYKVVDEPRSDATIYELPGSYKVQISKEPARYVYFDDKAEAEKYADSLSPKGTVTHLRLKVTFQSFGETLGDYTKYYAVDSSAAIGTLPTLKSIPGYTFDGWYVDDEKIDASYVPANEDVVVTASWSWNDTYKYAKAVNVEIPALVAGDMLPTTAKAYLTCEDGKTKIETSAALTWSKADGTVVEDCSDALADETYTVTALIAPASYVGVVYRSDTAVTFNDLAAESKAFVTNGNVKATYSVTTPAISINGAQVAVDGSTFAYTGSRVKPAVAVTLDGVELEKGTDYTVKYAANKKVGTATVTVTGTGIYAGTVAAQFDIVPASVTNLKATAAKKSVKLAWDKRKAQTDGFVICWATSKVKLAKGKALKTATVKKAAAKSYTASKLKSGKRYYFKVRAYKVVDGVKVYSAWSAVKGAKAK